MHNSTKEMSMQTYRVLFLGDIVGKPGRQAVHEGLHSLIASHEPLFVVANGENAAGGVGITPAIANELINIGVDAITLGNHAFNKREVYGYLDGSNPIVRPYNMPASTPGKGSVVIEKGGVRLLVANICGRVFMDGYDDPFAASDKIVAEADTSHILVDFHAEATSEKIAMGYHLDGRVTAVVGTHTHVTTADDTVLSQGTAYITDVGMCGPLNSVLGMDREIILRRFRSSLPEKFDVAHEPGVINAVLLDVEYNTGRTAAIQRLRFG
jgi:metallophosphoesterase (TIGR00282 family)